MTETNRGLDSPGGLPTQPRFPIGYLYATPRAMEALSRSRQWVQELLERHANGDWGDVPAEWKERMDRAVVEGAELLSCYRLGSGECVWLLTGADRKLTTVHLRSDPEHPEVNPETLARNEK